MKSVQKGFTLIELMIVVAIVGILAAVAIPAYQDFTIRSKMSEVAAALGACKTSVAEYYADRTAWPEDVQEAGCTEDQSRYVAEITVADGGVITAEEQNTGATGGCTLTLSATTATDGETVTVPDPTTGDAIAGWVGSTSCEFKHVPGLFRR